MAHALWIVLLPESKQIYLLPITVPLTEFFCSETSRTWLSLGPDTRHCGFLLGSSPSRTWLTDEAENSVPATWVWVPISGKQFQTQLSERESWWAAQYFVNSGIDGERSWRMGGKSSEKIMPRNPFHNLLEKLLNAWPVPTVFIGLILGTKEVKERRAHWGNSH